MDHRVFLALIFVLSGTFNVLVVKWAYQQQVTGSDGQLHGFQHPVVFTLLMFFGEFLCFVAYKLIRLISSRRGVSAELLTKRDKLVIRYLPQPVGELDSILGQGSSEFSPMSMLLPTVLDVVSSILLFTGLYLTYATSFQMIREATLIFVGIFSTMLLNHSLGSQHFLAILIISCGLLVIISQDVRPVDNDGQILPHSDYKSILTGDLLILIAGILHGLQYVYEEKQLKTTNVAPLQAAGWQGIFGLVITSFLAIALHFLPTMAPFGESSRAVFDDWSDLWTGLQGNPALVLALIGFTLSCAAYNFIGLYITMYSSSANRLFADGLRVYFIWVFGVFMNWEYINLITFMGFLILQVGITHYRKALFLDWYRAVITRWQRARYVDLTADSSAAAPQSRPADVI
ncbi:hypothetical protein KR009_011946 [Drosophila setifemur]|nr:hypothetical protein KR009_011946 [Drosophila setifemur]